jgi:SAM-dependent methyltransferase
MTRLAAEGGPAASPETWFHRRATSYVETQMLFHLNEVGVLGLLSGGEWYTPAAIADALRLDTDAVEAVLAYVLAVDDLLECDDAGRYALSAFGRDTVERFSGADGAINMFDVRVGAYGPVWANLGRMLRGDGRYGQDFHRDGRYAEAGVSKLAMRFWDSLVEHVEEIDARQIVEVGLTTGLLERLALEYPERPMYGLDRCEVTIERAAASARANGSENVRWLRRDFFDTAGWATEIDASQPGMVYSLHVHELLARGEDALLRTLRELRKRLPGWTVLAFEQPRLPEEQRARVSELLWLYSQSNILIHHLIGNGRILSRDAWLQLGREAGCSVTDRPCDYLGYRAFRFEL